MGVARAVAPGTPISCNLKELQMLPVGKVSKSYKRMRRSHHARKPLTPTGCPKCGKAKLAHCACSHCGYVSAKLMLPVHAEEV